MLDLAYDHRVKHYMLAPEDVKKPDFVRSMRIAKLRELVRPPINLLSAERARLVTESYKETEGLPVEIRRAKAADKILSEMTIYLMEGSLIVGNSAPTPMGGKLFPELGIDWIEAELDTISTRAQDPYYASEKVKAELREHVIPYWRGKTVNDVAHGYLPPEIADEEFKLWVWGLIKNAMGTGHLAFDFEKLFRFGLGGLKKVAQEKLAALDYQDPEAIKKQVFYRAIIIAMDAGIKWARRYAAYARELAQQEKDPQRKQELEMIASNCEWVPENSPRTFWEGVQAVWFLCLLPNISGAGSGIEFGRMDQYLYPLYKKDIEEGRITKEFAQDILECFWCIDNCDAYLAFDKDVASRYAYFPMAISIPTVGGQTPDGRDASNELSHMMLDAEMNVQLAAPEFSARIHEKMPDEYLHHVAEVIRLGTGKPKIFADEGWYDRALKMGYTIEEARNYIGAFCAESSTVGDTYWVPENGIVFGGGARLIELTMNHGKSLMTGEQLGLDVGDVTKFSTFDEFMAAFKKEVDFVINKIEPTRQAIHLAHAEVAPNPFTSAFMNDCLERGLDWEKGGARHYRYGAFNMGFTCAGNSLAAIKKLVYDDKVVTMEELVNACRTNFEGKRGEEIRQLCLNAPKWGNDDDYVDALIREAVLIDLDAHQPFTNPFSKTPSTITFDILTSHLPFGSVVGATPDGRKNGDPLNEGGVSPYQGTDSEGPTAVLKSIAKLPWDDPRVYGGVLNIKFSRNALAGEDNLTRFMALLRTWCDLHGQEVQFNCIDHETLRDAQEHPDQHRNLLIRVAGYSSYFVELDRVVQDDIITRTVNEAV